MSSLTDAITELRDETGVESAPHVVTVERDAVEAFGGAVGTPPRSDRAGALVVPPTFATRLISYHRPEWYQRLGFVGLFHTGEKITSHRPVAVGDTLSWTWCITEIVERTGRDGRTLWFITTRYAFSDPRGVRVMDVDRTFVISDRS